MTHTCCDRCGVELQIADFPFCPHGRGITRVHGDEIPGGGYVDHNLGREPITITHWSQRRAIMAARGLVDSAVGTDLPRPDGMAPNPQAPSNWSAYRDVSPAHLAWLADRLCTGRGTKDTPNPDLQIQQFTPIVGAIP